MDRDLLKQELIRDEGIRHFPYSDTLGHKTIGIGRNLDANPIPDVFAIPLTNDAIDSIYQEDSETAIRALLFYLPWFAAIDDVRQRVLANMCFNMGIENLLGFKNTLLFIEKGNYQEAAHNMRNSAWYAQVKERAERLSIAMESGVMPC